MIVKYIYTFKVVAFSQVSQVTVKTASVEKKEVVKQVSVEEEVTKKEALER